MHRLFALLFLCAAVNGSDMRSVAPRSHLDATRSAVAVRRLRGGAEPLKEPLAFLLDIDGTLVVSDDLYFLAFKELLTPKGFTVDEPWYAANVLGKTDNQVFTSLFPEATAAEVKDLGVQKDKLFCKLYHKHCKANGGPPMVAGLPEALETAKALGIKAIAVTNAPRGAAEACIASLRKTIPAASIINKRIIIGAECQNAKPHPEPYLTGAGVLGYKPEQCIVFEDSGSGVRAGVAAGAKAVVGITSALSHKALKKLGATKTVDSWSEITPDVLRALAGER